MEGLVDFNDNLGIHKSWFTTSEFGLTPKKNNILRTEIQIEIQIKSDVESSESVVTDEMFLQMVNQFCLNDLSLKMRHRLGGYLDM